MSMQAAERMQASVLVVDDEARQLAALCDTLEDTGYKTTGFTSATEALAALRETEFDLLLTLAKSPNVVFTREKLFEILKADNYDTFDRAIDVQITRIRKKLGDKASDPSFIQTVRKVGYKFIAVTEKS